MKIANKIFIRSPLLSILVLLAIILICSACTPKVKVKIGSDIISKQVFYKPRDKAAFLRLPDNIDYNFRSDLILLRRAYKNPYEHNLIFLSKEGTLKSSILLNYYDLLKFFLVDIDNDGFHEFYTISPKKVSLLDMDGKIVWEFSPGRLKDLWIEYVGLGDLDGDGFSEFVAAFETIRNNSTYVFILDHQGNLKNQFELPVERFHLTEMKVFDTNGDGMSEIVCGGVNGFHILDSKGNLLHRFKTDWEGWYLNLWNDINKKPLIYGPKGKSILLTDLTGMTVDEIHLSKGGLGFRHIPPISVHIKGINEGAFIAATREISYVYDRSYFYIFDSSGKLIYEEVLPDRIEGILPVLDEKAEKEYLLVSFSGTIWAYKLK